MRESIGELFTPVWITASFLLIQKIAVVTIFFLCYDLATSISDQLRSSNGGNHDLYTNGISVEPIPRHPDIRERLARDIIKRQNLK